MYPILYLLKGGYTPNPSQDIYWSWTHATKHVGSEGEGAMFLVIQASAMVELVQDDFCKL